MDAWLEELELNLSYLSIYRHPTAEPRCTPAGGRGWGEVGLIVQNRDVLDGDEFQILWRLIVL